MLSGELRLANTDQNTWPWRLISVCLLQKSQEKEVGGDFDLQICVFNVLLCF